MQQELTLEQQRDQKLEVLKGYYQAALNMAKQNGEDTAQLEKAYKDVQIQIEKEYITKQKELLDEQTKRKNKLGRLSVLTSRANTTGNCSN